MEPAERNGLLHSGPSVSLVRRGSDKGEEIVVTLSFRTHPLFRLFVAPRPQIEPLAAITQGSSDTELAHLAAGEAHRIDHLRAEAMSLIYGGARSALLPLG
jgi:hypothetical protein